MKIICLKKRKTNIVYTLYQFSFKQNDNGVTFYVHKDEIYEILELFHQLLYPFISSRDDY